MLMRQKGISLVEFMVAVLISGIIMIAVGQIYVHSKGTYTWTMRQADAQESLRMAEYFLAFDIRQAGYRACGGEPVNRLRDPELFPNLRIKAWSSAPPEYLDPDEVKAGTHVIAVSFAQTTMAGVIEPWMPTPAGALHVNTGSDVEKGDILLVTNCRESDIFQVAGSEDPITSGTIAHNTGGAVDPGNASRFLSTSYEGDAQLYRMVTHIYYVSPQNVLMRLWIKKGTFVAEDLVGHISDLQTTFILKKNGGYTRATPDSVVEWQDVDSVYLQVSADFPPARPFRFSEILHLRNR